MGHTPLPPQLRTPFAIHEALAAGVGEGRLRGADLERPFHGVRARAPLESTLDLCRAYAPLLRPGQYFSHSTAAALWGWPLPIEHNKYVHVTTSAPQRAPRGRGVCGHQAHATEATERFGLPVSMPVRTWISLAAVLGLRDLVAVGDAMILDPSVLELRDPRPHATIEEVYLASKKWGGRGARAVTSALTLMRQGAESRPETLLRLLIVFAGLPEPELNVAVTDATGRWLGRGDMVFARWRTVVEYDGSGHLASLAQYERDITRIENFVSAGWNVVRVRKHGLFVAPEATITRITRALKLGGWGS